MLYHMLSRSSIADHDFSDLHAVVDVAVKTREHDVVVGLDSIVTLDDAVIRELIRALRKLREFGGALHLDTSRHSICTALRQNGLDRIFPILAPA